MSYLDRLLASAANKVKVYRNGALVSEDRDAIDLKGSGVSGADNTGTQRVDITIPGLGDALATSAPPAIAASSSVGTGTTAARADHTHAANIPTSRRVATTAPISGGGDLSADLTLSLLYHSEGSIVAKDDSGTNKLAVGALALDSEHGNLGWSATGIEGTRHHALATSLHDGFMSAADKTKLDAYPAYADLAAVIFQSSDTFDTLLTFDANKRQTAPNAPSAMLYLAPLAGATHTPGTTIVTIVPPGYCAGITIAPIFRPGGDALFDSTSGAMTDFDSANRYVITITRLDDLSDYKTVVTIQTAADATDFATSPDIESATIDAGGAPTHLVLVCSKPVLLEDLAGLTYTTTGTAATITGVVSGDGTNSPVLLLSAAAAGGDTASITVGSGRKIQDFAGNLLATGTKSITIGVPGLVSQAAWTRCWEVGKDLLPSSPGNFTSWTDQVGGSLQLTPASSGHAQTASEGVVFSGAANERIHLTGLSLGSGDWSIFVRFRKTSTGQQAAFSFDDGASNHRAMVYSSLGSHFVADVYDGSHNPAPDDSGWTVDDGYHTAFMDFVQSTGTVTITVDSRSPVSATIASTSASGLTELTVGCAYLGSENFKLTGAVSDIAYKVGAVLTPTEKTNILSYIAGR